MLASGNREIEIKLRVDSADTAAAMLKRAAFQISRQRTFESNAVFDTSGRRLRAAGQLLRLRHAGGQTILTYKGPATAARHKSREELETLVESMETMTAILHRLGYEPSFLYEKYRTEFSQPDGAGVATVDETPIGTFVELEGAAEWIDRVAAELGFAEGDYITASYGGLYLAWCAERGLSPGNMTFR